MVLERKSRSSIRCRARLPSLTEESLPVADHLAERRNPTVSRPQPEHSIGEMRGAKRRHHYRRLCTFHVDFIERCRRAEPSARPESSTADDVHVQRLYACAYTL